MDVKPEILLPNELWREVFELIPPDVLPDATLTCRAFRSLGASRLFHTVKFRPYFLDIMLWSRGLSAPQVRYMPTDDAIKDDMERLQFYASPSISQYVQRCDIAPRDTYKVSEGLFSGTADPNLLLDTFFQILPQFSNLQQLHFQSIEFNSLALSKLSLIPDIHLIDITSCNVLTTNLPLPTVHVRTFNFSHTGHPELLSHSGADKWKLILDQNHLESVALWPDRASAAFFRDVTTLPLFLATRKLSMALPLSLLPELPTILKQFPSLRQLKISQFGTQDARESRSRANQISRGTVSPPLVKYEGPYDLVHVVVASEMTSLSLDSFGSLTCDPDTLGGLLASYKNELKSLKFLKLKLSSLNLSFFTTICSQFTSLKSLVIEGNYDNDAFTPTGFLDKLPLDVLPFGIEHFLLSWTAEDYENAERKSILFKDRLLARHPSLKLIWLSDWKQLALMWKQDESGQTQESYPLNDEFTKFTVIPILAKLLSDIQYPS